MPFADLDDRTSYESKFKKMEFIDLSASMNTVRILDDKPNKTYTHYVRGSYIECIGEDCPVCSNNKKLIAENPDNFRTIGGYSAKSERFVVNVFDKTNVKLCSKCGHEVKKAGEQYPSSCPKCGQMITTIAESPLNKVKILAKGKDLFNQFNVLEMSTLDANKDPMGLQNFDITLFVTGSGRETKIMAVPQPTSVDKVEVTPDMLFDTTRATLKLKEDEINDLLRGVAIKDILVARKSSKDDKLESETIVTSDEVKAQVNSLFNK